MPPDYEDLDYEIVQEGLNEYDLADGITVRGQILLAKIKRDPRDHRRIHADTVKHLNIHAPADLRGPPNMQESRSDEKHRIRVTKDHAPWSIYRILQTGQVLKIKLDLDGVYKFKDAYDEDGYPRYDIQSIAKVLVEDNPDSSDSV